MPDRPPPPVRRQPDGDRGPRDPGPGLPRRPPLSAIAMLLIGAAMGAYGTLTWTERPTTRVVTGVVVAIDDTGAAIRVASMEDPDEDLFGGRGVGIVGAQWREAAAEGEDPQPWQRTASDAGYPTCLTPGAPPRAVTLGLVTDPGAADRPPSEVVAWLQCGPAAASDPSEDAGGG